MASANDVDYKTATSIYDFTVKDTYGNDVPLENYRGHVVLIVNIASQCGLAKSNYAKLTQLHKDYYEKGNKTADGYFNVNLYSMNWFFFVVGLRILTFPCNQFASQMPEGNSILFFL